MFVITPLISFDMKAIERTVKISGHSLFTQQIYVSDEIKAPVLVFLHDALGCVSSWKNFPSNLCELTGLNGLVYDRIGHGQSSPTSTMRNVDYLEHEAAVILPKMLSKFGISEKILVGHSDGATIALIYEAIHQNCDALISISGHMMVEDITMQAVAKTASQLLEEGQLDNLEKHHGDKAKKLVNDWKGIWLSNDFKSWNIKDQIHEIDCPTMVIQGRNDEFATESHAVAISNGIGSLAETLMPDNCGHFPHKEIPEMILKAISKFVLQVRK
jgi:pimeloyl-ACP methyl ester carboxylesterase